MAETQNNLVTTSDLDPRRAHFVREYLKTGEGAASARAAGYSHKNARNTAHRLLHKDEKVIAAIAEARKNLSEQTSYELIDAMREIDKDLERARDCKQMTAAAKLLEMKMKLNGLLIDRQDVRQIGGFQIQILGLENG